MAISAEWIINKAKQKIYVVTHAKAAARGDSTVDDDLTTIEANIADLQTQIGNVNNEELNTHIAQSLFSEEGAHRFRLIQNSYNQDELQYKNENGEWVTIATASNGLAPGDMKSSVAVLGNAPGEVVLSGTDPDDTEVDGTIISRWTGTKIVRKAGSAPTSPDDGVLVANYQVKNQHSTADTGVVDSGLTADTTYYYRWFTYADNGAVNTTGNSSASIYVPSASILGVTADWENNTYTRTDDAVGLTAGANFDQFKMFGQRRRCIVADDRTILAFYGDEAYTETGKLTQAVTKNETTYPVGTSCQVMVYQPKFYYKVTPDTLLDNPCGVGYMIRKATYQVSEAQYLGFKVHPNFVRDGVELPYMLQSAYEACTQSSADAYITTNASLGNRLASIADAKPATGSDGSNTHNFTRAVARNLAANRGTGWQIGDILTVSCSQLLFMVEYSTMDSQTTIGQGNITGASDYSGVTSTGGTAELGNASGRDTGECCVAYRGEENLWGNVFLWCDGVNTYNSNVGMLYIADHGFADEETESPYRATGYNFARNNGYISAFGYQASYDFLFIPCETKGDSANPVGDVFSQNYSHSSITAVRMGGSCGSSLGSTQPGLFYWFTNTVATSSMWHTGSRLACIPSSTAVEE